jgi:hypothetical protein
VLFLPIFLFLVAVPIGVAESLGAPCDDPLSKKVRDERGTWTLDSARVIADETASAGDRKTRFDKVISCLDATIEEGSKTKTIDGKAVPPNWKSILVMQSIKASLKLLETEADLYDLHVNTFAATTFSNLYREKSSDGFFSKSRPFLDFEISQVVTGDRALETFGNIGFQGTAAVSESNATETIQKSNSFFADAGVIFFPNLLTISATRRGNIGVGLVADLGIVAVPQETVPAQGAGSTISDSFSPTYRVGFMLRQLSGHWLGSFTEYAWLHDPRFDHKSRSWVRGRLRFGRENSDNAGHGLSSFLEGSANIGRGKDEARIVVGVGLDTEKVLKAILGLGSTQKQAAADK